MSNAAFRGAVRAEAAPWPRGESTGAEEAGGEGKRELV
jgi:hypothetical protein